MILSDVSINRALEEGDLVIEPKPKVIQGITDSKLSDAARRHLDECPDEPVSIEAIARAAEMSIFDVEHSDPCALEHE